MNKPTKATSFKMPSVMSKKKHDANRAATLADAIYKCLKEGKRCPDEWIKEIGDLNKTFAK